MEGPVPAGGGGADREGFGGGARSVRPAAGVPWPETGRPPGRGDGGACLPRYKQTVNDTFKGDTPFGHEFTREHAKLKARKYGFT